MCVNACLPPPEYEALKSKLRSEVNGKNKSKKSACA